MNIFKKRPALRFGRNPSLGEIGMADGDSRILRGGLQDGSVREVHITCRIACMMKITSPATFFRAFALP